MDPQELELWVWVKKRQGGTRKGLFWLFLQRQYQAPIRAQWWATDFHSWLGCEALSGKPLDTGAHRQWPRGVVLVCIVDCQ